MNAFFVTLILGISLSMDAFSLALGYGTCGFSKSRSWLLSLIVGFFHFFMPLIGLLIGSILYEYFIFDFRFVVGIILGIIGLEMIISSVRDSDVSMLFGIFSYFLFGFSVSIDSFTTGIGIRAINDNWLEVSFIFMLCSSLFTYFGLRLGNVFSNKFGNISTIFGGGMLIFFSLYYIF